METHQNPLLFDQNARMIKIEDIDCDFVKTRPIRNVKKERLLLWRKENAAEAIKGLTTDNEIYGFTKGQFSLLDLFKACLAKTGPPTWTYPPGRRRERKSRK